MRMPEERPRGTPMKATEKRNPKRGSKGAAVGMEGGEEPLVKWVPRIHRTQRLKQNPGD